MRSRRSIALIPLLWLLSACGFTPMYADSSTSPAVTEEFAAIQVGIIPDRIGQVVRNHLLESLNPYGEPSAARYVLSVALEESAEGFGFRADEAVTRESFRLMANFQLLESATGNVVFEETVSAVHAYDVVQSDFANFSAQEDAKARTAEQVSQLITLRLGAFFKSSP